MPVDIEIAKSIVLLANLALFILRARHGIRAHHVAVEKRHQTALRDIPLSIAKGSCFLPILWAFLPIFVFSDYQTRLEALLPGIVLYLIGLWLFHRSHVDLGTNWSQTLELKDDHFLVTEGVYRRVRHPMYLGMLIFALGQALVACNFIAGPSFAVGTLALITMRVKHGERMMTEQFGEAYIDYCARTHRLLPGIW